MTITMLNQLGEAVFWMVVTGIVLWAVLRPRKR